MSYWLEYLETDSHRKLTEAEKQIVKTSVSEYTLGEDYNIGFIDGFIAGLETQDSRISELERQLAEAKRAIFILEQLPLGL